MKIYNQIIVVEGKHDEQRIKSIYPEVDCIVTNGSEISKETLNLIYQASLTREVILFLDPDYPGKKITNQILETKGDFKIAFINKEKAISKNLKKVGIEHASKEDIKNSLDSYFSTTFEGITITRKDLVERRLIDCESSSDNRRQLCKSLNIPVSNGKALLKTLNMLGVSIERIDELIER
ncbi:MAG TPA: ribonuclease M5 [Bacillota bacterium]|nr:ribonuclease M5 [Bacillota bacterium]